MTRKHLREKLILLRQGAQTILVGEYRTIRASSPNSSVDAEIALDANGAIHVLFAMPHGSAVIQDKTSASVQLVERELLRESEKMVFADLVCDRPDLEDIFCLLAEEVLVKVNEAPRRPDVVARSVLADWRDLLNRAVGGPLSREQLVGLFGELLVLSELGEQSPVLKHWSGAKRQRHDFSLGTDALEVKTTTSTQRDIVKINGLEQLEPPQNGRLYLRRFRIEEVDQGTSVPDLVARLLAQGVDAAELMRALADQQYFSQHSQDYEKHRFAIRDDSVWQVSPGFPRLSRQSLADAHVPAGVHVSAYEVDLGYASEFKLSQMEWDGLMADWRKAR